MVQNQFKGTMEPPRSPKTFSVSTLFSSRKSSGGTLERKPSVTLGCARKSHAAANDSNILLPPHHRHRRHARCYSAAQSVARVLYDRASYKSSMNVSVEPQSTALLRPFELAFYSHLGCCYVPPRRAQLAAFNVLRASQVLKSAACRLFEQSFLPVYASGLSDTVIRSPLTCRIVHKFHYCVIIRNRSMSSDSTFLSQFASLSVADIARPSDATTAAGTSQSVQQAKRFMIWRDLKNAGGKEFFEEKAERFMGIEIAEQLPDDLSTYITAEFAQKCVAVAKLLNPKQNDDALCAATLCFISVK
jgi:hypothetical protein